MQGFNTGMLLLLRAEGQVNSRTIAFALQLADIETCTAECRHALKSEYGCIMHISHKVQGLSFTLFFFETYGFFNVTHLYLEPKKKD